MGAPQYEQAGADIAGSGTPNTIPRWTGATTLGDSVITQSGTNIGIGTTSPSAKLHVVSADAATALLFAGATRGVRIGFNASTSSIEGVDNTAGSYQPLFVNGSTVTLGTGGSGRLAVDASGNVGIGTASPSAKLHLLSTATETVRFAATTSGIYSSFFRSSTTALGYIGDAGSLTTGGANADFCMRTESGSNLVFATGTAERARIDSSGNYGIGTTAIGGSRLAVNGGALPSGTVATGALYAAGSLASGRLCPALSSGTDLAVLNTFFDSSNIEISSGTTAGWTSGIVISARSASSATTADTVTFYTQGTRRVAVGTSSIDASLTANYGLKLPATPGNADTQTLDAYQESTWTPTLAGFGGTAPTVTSARYTRIGRTVTCSVIIGATGGAAYSSTWGSTTITAPFASGEYSVVPCAREAPGGSNGIQQGSLVYIPTFASSTAALWITWTYQV